jgi:hypothetical protein
MPENLRLFIAATTDLEAERAVIGRSIAALPIQIGIEIRRTPPLLPTFDEIFEKISNVDRVYFLMSNDITAPAGLEWNLAWRLERNVLPIRRSPKPTPAALEFFHLVRVPWLEFRSEAELTKIITVDLVRLLKHPANRYGLTVPELERLEAYLRRLERNPLTSTTELGGAEGGGVLLDAGHREPMTGVVVGE